MNEQMNELSMMNESMNELMMNESMNELMKFHMKLDNNLRFFRSSV